MCRWIALALLLSTTPALANAAASEKETAEFQALVNQCTSAWGTLNPDNVAPLYAKDAGNVFFDITPLKYSGWAEYDKGVRGAFAGFESLVMTPHNDLQVTRRGNLAWTTCTMQINVKEKSGKAMELEVRQTLIWEKRDGKWLIVHEHFSSPLPM